MAHYASELDYRRILKNSSKYYLEENFIKQVYKSGYMTISDINPLTFSYPVEYFDGILIRYYNSARYEELLDMADFLSSRIGGKLFLPHVPEKDRYYFEGLGFKSFYRISGLYKTDFNFPQISRSYKIEDFKLENFRDIELMDRTLFPYNWHYSTKDIVSLSRDKNIRIRVCKADNKLVGFIVARIDKNIGYGYITKLAVKNDYQRLGIGNHLMMDSMKFFKKNGILPIFTDTITDESRGFFEKFGFKVYSTSYLLVRE